MKRHRTKFTVILTFLAILANNSAFGSGFKDGIQELSIYGSGGLSSFRYKIPDANVSKGAGFNFGVGYNFFFNPALGVHIGAGLGTYNTKVKLNNSEIITRNLVDDEGDRFDMHTTLFGYSETQKAMFLNIPVMVIHEISTKQISINKNPIYIMGGVKMGIPFSGKYSAMSARLENSSYYPEYNNWIHSHEFTGNGNYNNKKFDGNFKLRTSFMLALEAGTRIKIDKDILLYVGTFFDYGLNNVLKDNNQSFIDYNPSDPSNFNANLFSVSDKANLMAAGLILRVHLNFKKSILTKQYRKRGNPYDRNTRIEL
jgi:hypothetical protein